MCVAHPVLAVAETAASGRGTGAYEAARSTVGAEYAFDRVDAEAGVSVSLAEDVHAWVAAHYLTGSANVSAATGGGEIKVTGLGPALGVAWGGASPYYAGAGYALTVYDIDLSSSTRGRLHAGGTGYGHSVDLEMGRHIALGERMTLTPRARAVGSRVSVDAFTDAVDARVSFPTTDRLMSSAGVVAETAPAWEDGAFSLRGSVDLERLLSGTETIAQVSGERLSLDAAANSVRASLRAVFRQGPVSVAAEGWLREGLDASAREYAGTLNVGIRF